MNLSIVKPLCALIAASLMCLIFILSFPAQVQAQRVEVEHHYGDIWVKRANDIENTQFRVNGKHFVWSDLNPKQQSSISQLFDQMDQQELIIQKDTKVIEAYSKKIESRAVLIEKARLSSAQVRLELVSNASVDPELAQELATLKHKAKRIDAIADDLEEEIHFIEQKMPKVNQQAIKLMNKYGDELEQELVSIAAQKTE
ncbi:hypothetical protein ACUR5C_16210 [Aliikangiella sp. IMCC44653]